MPISFITSMVRGCSPFGFVPALTTSNLLSARFRNKPSAIWLRAELPVHRNSTLFLLSIVFLPLVFYNHGIGILRQGRSQPTKQTGCGRSPRNLRKNKTGHIAWPDSRKRVRRRTRERNGWIGKRSRRGEPISSGDIGRNRERNRRRLKSYK